MRLEYRKYDPNYDKGFRYEYRRYLNPHPFNHYLSGVRALCINIFNCYIVGLVWGGQFGRYDSIER